jgi:hypothetical protein
MTGSVLLKFTIELDGSMSGAKATSADMDTAFVSCVEKPFHTLSFPQPEGGRAIPVTYQLTFAPG